MFAWLCGSGNREVIKTLEAENERLRTLVETLRQDNTTLLASEQVQMRLIAALRDCNADLDKRLSGEGDEW